jgi:hypothetical protein
MSTTRGITTSCIKATISYTRLVIVIDHTYLKDIIQDLLKERDFDPLMDKGSNLDSIASCILTGFKLITMLVTVVGSIRQKDISLISFNLSKQNPLSYYLVYLVKESFQKSSLIVIIISQVSIWPNQPSRLYR